MTMNRITLEQANRIVAAALAKGAELKLKPLSVAVLDPGGHLIAFQRQDGASSLRHAIAAGKAGGALALGFSSRQIAEQVAARPAFINSLGGIAPSGIIPVPGGVIVVDQAGEVIGAVGATGDTSDNDETCVLAGIAAAGLKPQG
jgi:uncharacterized protein GlcG (DUF336 family)